MTIQNDLKIVALSDAPIEAVAEIWHRGWHDAHATITPDALTKLRTKEDFVHRLQNATFYSRIALQGSQVLGFVAVDRDQLDQMYVASEARGKGVAQALMHAALGHMCETGIKTAWLACGIGNAQAAAFYEKTGWVNVGTKTVALETTDGPFKLDVWRFEKVLSE